MRFLFNFIMQNPSVTLKGRYGRTQVVQWLTQPLCFHTAPPVSILNYITLSSSFLFHLVT